MLVCGPSHWAGALSSGFGKACVSGAATVETVGAADLDTAWEIGRTCRDQDFSIVDRTSFAVHAAARH